MSFDGVTFTGNGFLANGLSLTLKDSTVNGNIDLGTTSANVSRADVGVIGTLTVGPSAEIAANEDSRIFVSSSGANIVNNGTISYTNTGTQTASLGGRLDVQTTNNSLISFNGGTFNINAAVTQGNGGVVRVFDNTNLNNNGTLDQTAGGLLELSTNSSLQGSSVVVGGEVRMASTGTSFVRGTVRDSLMTGSGTVNNGVSLTIDGATLQGSLDFGTTAATLSRADLGVVNQFTIGGTGSLNINEDARVFVASSGASVLNNGTIAFANTGTPTASLGGRLDVNTTNNGLLSAATGTLQVNASVDGSGETRVTDGGTIDFNGTLFRQGKLDVTGGTFDSGSSRFEVTEVMGDISILGGSVGSGEFAGSTSTFFNDLTLGNIPVAARIVDVDTHDSYVIGEDLTFGSSTTLSLDFDPSFVAEGGNNFDLFTIEGVRNGTFQGRAEASSVGTFGEEMFITYNGGNGNDIFLYALTDPNQVVFANAGQNDDAFFVGTRDKDDATTNDTFTFSNLELYDGAALTVGANETISVGSNGTVTVGDQALFNGHGVVEGNVLNAGLIRDEILPGSGTDVTEDFTQTSSGALRVFIEGDTTPGDDYSQFIVDGAAQLDGELQIVFDAENFNFTTGYVPTVGDTFDLIVASGGITLGNDFSISAFVFDDTSSIFEDDFLLEFFDSGFAGDPDSLLKFAGDLFNFELVNGDTILRATLLAGVSEEIPLPGAALLFASGLLGLRLRKKASSTSASAS
ncbi:MAG: hypothetical protein AAF225_14395 [Pseudomonadota bacterium]